MENNIFKNAYFGKVYKTRDGIKAIFYMHTSHGAILLTEKHGLAHYHFDGTIFYCTNKYDNLISEWQEPIDESKLDELAREYEDNYPLDDSAYSYYCYDGFKAGYRKAMEE